VEDYALATYLFMVYTHVLLYCLTQMFHQ